MSDRLQEIRARLDAYERDGCMAEVGDHFTASDIAWLLDEVERLRNTSLSAANPLCDGGDA